MVKIMSGNAIPNSMKITPYISNIIFNHIQNILPDTKIYRIGSAGKKAEANDMDLMIDSNSLNESGNLKEIRKQLEEIFQNLGYNTSRSGVSVHVGIPVGSEIAQVDLMIVENAEQISKLHQHDYSHNNMTGGQLHAMMSDLATSKSYLLSPYKGLFNRATNEFITADKNEIAKYLIDESASEKNLESTVALLESLKNKPEYILLKNKYFPEYKIGSANWFRNTIDILEDVSQSELDIIQKYANKFWGTLGIKIVFTNHFLDRINDKRNNPVITAEELMDLLKQEFKLHGVDIAKLNSHTEGVMVDMAHSLNLPFVKDRKNIIGKSVQRKPNFKTTSQIFKI